MYLTLFLLLDELAPLNCTLNVYFSTDLETSCLAGCRWNIWMLFYWPMIMQMPFWVSCHDWFFEGTREEAWVSKALFKCFPSHLTLLNLLTNNCSWIVWGFTQLYHNYGQVSLDMIAGNIQYINYRSCWRGKLPLGKHLEIVHIAYKVCHGFSFEIFGHL